MKLLDKLEEIKQMGNYAVQLHYGENIGCDDSDVKKENRKITVFFYPVGCLGTVKIMFKGIIDEFLRFNLKTKPKLISNPPQKEEYEEGGYYLWGTKDGTEKVLNKPFHGKWEN